MSTTSQRARQSDMYSSTFPKLITVDKWDGSGVKHALDDTLKTIFNKIFNFSENFKFSDVKIFLSLIATLFAAVALVYDYFMTFPNSYNVILICVIGYGIVMTILTICSTFFEKNNVYCGFEKNSAGFRTGAVINVESTMKRFDHKYTIKMIYQPRDGKQTRLAEESYSITNWLDESGVLDVAEFGRTLSKLSNQLMN